MLQVTSPTRTSWRCIGSTNRTYSIELIGVAIIFGSHSGSTRLGILADIFVVFLTTAGKWRDSASIM
jgi:hypothetical protein